MPKRLTIIPHMSVDELHLRYRQAKDPVERNHLHLLWLLEQGQPTEAVAKATGYTHSWIREIANRYNDQGPEGLGDRRYANPGQTCLLSPEQEKTLEHLLQQPPDDGGLWSGPKVAAWMSQQLGRTVKRQQGWLWLRRLNYTPQRPRPYHRQRLTVARWYGEVNRLVEIASGTDVWYHAGKPPVTIRWVLIRDPQKRFDTQALLCTDPEATVTDIVLWFVRRWSVEVTFEETRAHLGIETQRQWSKRAIARTTTILLGLFSLVTLIADRLVAGQTMPVRTSAWYRKTQPTFSGALALVRRHFWRVQDFSTSRSQIDVEKTPNPLLARCIELLCYAT